MKKASIVVHQDYVERVIKKLHETGLMQIIDVSKDEPGFSDDDRLSTWSSDASICVSYELRLSRLISILAKVKPRKTGLKAFLSPETTGVKTVEERSLDEIYSNAEGLLAEIEKEVLEEGIDKYSGQHSERDHICQGIQVFSNGALYF